MNVKKNIVLNSLYQILNIIVPIITSPYLSRVIGAEGIGTYAYYNSIAYYFILFIMLGLNNYGNRSIARVKDNKRELSKEFTNIYCLQVLTGIIGILIYIVGISVVVKNSNIIPYINIIYVCSAIFDINWFFSGLEKFQVIVIRNIVVKFLSLCSILLFVREKDDIIVYVFIMAASTLVSQLSTWPFVYKEVEISHPSLEEIKRHIKPNLVLFIPVIAVSLYKIMDKIMLGLLSTKIEVGYYENSERIINIPQALVNSLGTVMLPRITNLLALGETSKTKQYTRDSMQYAIWMSVAMASGLMGISSNFVVTFFGKGFEPCAQLIFWLAPTIIFNAWANVIRTQFLIPLNKDKSYIISVSIGAISNLVINSILIGNYGAMGAVIGTFIAEFLVMFIQTLYVRKDFDTITYICDSWCFFIPGVIMYILVRYIATLHLNGISVLVLQLMLGGAIYIISSIAVLFIINKQRLYYILSNLRIKK